MLMTSTKLSFVCTIITAALFAATLQAATITHVARPDQVPDEEPPRINVGDAPAGFGPDSWQGPATGKTNWHARYIADGDYLSVLFPADVAGLTINDIESISYHTNRPAGTPAGRDWWVQIYTRPTGSGDDASWYKSRFINNYNDHTHENVWMEHSTDTGMTFRKNSGTTTGHMSLGDLQNDFGTELIEMFSVQTDSGWNGFDGYMDGLTITLTNGSVGIVNFEAIPEPTSLTLLGMSSLALLFRRNRR